MLFWKLKLQTVCIPRDCVSINLSRLQSNCRHESSRSISGAKRKEYASLELSNWFRQNSEMYWDVLFQASSSFHFSECLPSWLWHYQSFLCWYCSDTFCMSFMWVWTVSSHRFLRALPCLFCWSFCCALTLLGCQVRCCRVLFPLVVGRRLLFHFEITMSYNSLFCSRPLAPSL